MTSNGQTRHVSRRTALKLTGTAGITGLAGCIGGDGGDGDDGDGDGGTEPAEYPAQSIEFIIPFGPGGGYDYYGRLLSEYLPDHLEGVEQVQPRNVEGAGGQIAIQEVRNADDDPRIHWVINVPNFSLTQLAEDVDWDLREFSYFGQIVEEPRGIAVGANTDLTTWDDYVAAVQNEDLNFASTGPGSGYVTVPGTVGEVAGLYPAENVMDNQVVYDGRGEAIQGVLAGDVQAVSGAYYSILPYVESGDLRMLMACTLEDAPPEPTPDAATLASADIDNRQQIVDMQTDRRAIGGPPNLADEAVGLAQDAYMAALEDDDLLAEAEEADRPIAPATGPEAREAITNFINGWAERADLLRTLFGLEDDVEVSP